MTDTHRGAPEPYLPPGNVHVGDWVCLWVRRRGGGGCPVGEVVERTEWSVKLELLDWVMGQTMPHRTRTVSAWDVAMWVVAPPPVDGITDTSALYAAQMMWDDVVTSGGES